MTQQIFTDSVAIQGSQDTTQLVVQGNGTQTQPLQSWLNQAGTLQAQVTGDGRLQIGNNLGAGAPADALIQANNDLTLPSALPSSGWHTLGRLTGALSSAVAWVVHELQLLGTGGVSGLQTAMRAKLTHSNTGTSTSAELRALDAQTVNQGGASGAAVGQATGLRATASNAAGAYLAKAVGVEAALTNDTDGSLTQAIAFAVVPPVNAGSIGTLYGLQVPNLTQGDANYALYTGQGLNQLGDQLSILGSGNRVQAIIQAASGQSANLQEWRASDGTPLAAVDSSGSLGIGTSAPTDALTVVAGGARFDGPYVETTTNAGVYAGSLNSTSRIMFTNGNPSQNWQIDNDAGTFRWYTPGSTFLSLTPAGLLTLTGQLSLNNMLRLREVNGNLCVRNGGDTAETTLNALKVGINIGSGSTPSNDLEVNGSGRFEGAFVETTTNVGVFLGNVSGSSRIMLTDGNSAHNWQIDNNGGDFRWYLPGVTWMILKNGGNAGFGTSSPAAQLHVLTSDAANPGLIVQAAVSQSANLTEWQDHSGAAQLAIAGNGRDVVLDTATGSKIGTATNQKLGFFNATPVVQQTGGAATAGASYGTNEQTMLQTVYSALRTYGLLS